MQTHAQTVLKEMGHCGVMVNAHGKKIAVFHWVNIYNFGWKFFSIRNLKHYRFCKIIINISNY